MAKRHEDVNKLFNSLKRSDQKVAYEFMQYLASKKEVNNDYEGLQSEEDDLRDYAWSAEHLLSLAGTISRERGKELLEEVKKSREEWDDEQ